eukprot:CAMPEP_0114527360 /NCGR_PEP_ID=MMETSP0109-20121206/23571_1 /TAXON_ID=29199 /ORGANISM="Chlorarachnion reptans, Strain CCCM449" /LENGTH=1847 /DNA_ID=CAMNT_0001709313 /DNA_START=6 /DNA_END=5549 /DNA_ORIENTATION=-
MATPVKCGDVEQLFNNFPRARRKTALVVALLRDAATVINFGRLPFVRYVETTDKKEIHQELNAIKLACSQIAGRSLEPVCFVLGDDDVAEKNCIKSEDVIESGSAEDTSFSFAQRIAQEENIRTHWVDYAAFSRRYQFLQNIDEKHASRDWYPSEILPNFIYIGSKSQVQYIDRLKDLRITNLISCVQSSIISQEHMAYFETDIEIIESFAKGNFRIYALLDAIQKEKKRVVVFDDDGNTASLAVVVAYIMMRQGVPLASAMKRVESKLSSFALPQHLRDELKSFEGELNVNLKSYTRKSIQSYATPGQNGNNLNREKVIFEAFASPNKEATSSDDKLTPNASDDKHKAENNASRVHPESKLKMPTPVSIPNSSTQMGFTMKMSKQMLQEPSKPMPVRQSPRRPDPTPNNLSPSTLLPPKTSPEMFAEKHPGHLTVNFKSYPTWPPKKAANKAKSRAKSKINSTKSSDATHHNPVRGKRRPNALEVPSQLDSKNKISSDSGANLLSIDPIPSPSVSTPSSVLSFDSVTLTDPNGQQIALASPNASPACPSPLGSISETDNETDNSANPHWKTVELIPRFLHVCILSNSEEDRLRTNLVDIENQTHWVHAECRRMLPDWRDRGISSIVILTHQTDQGNGTQEKLDDSLVSINVATWSNDAFADSILSLNKVLEKVFLCRERYTQFVDETVSSPQAVVIAFEKNLAFSAIAAFKLRHELTSLACVLKSFDKIETFAEVKETTKWKDTFMKLLCTYEPKVYSYARSAAEPNAMIVELQQHRYVTIGPRQLFNFLRQGVASTDRRQTQILIWDTRSEDLYKSGHIKAGQVEAANLPLLEDKAMPLPDDMHSRIKNIRLRLAWKSWRLRDLVIYGDEPRSKDGEQNKNRMKRLAAYLSTQMKGTCWLLSDFGAFKRNYPYLLKASLPVGYKDMIKIGSFMDQHMWYPQEILEGFLYFTDLSTTTAISRDLVSRLHEMRISDILFVNPSNPSDSVDGFECHRVYVTGGLIGTSFTEYAKAFQLLDSIRANSSPLKCSKNGNSSNGSNPEEKSRRRRVLVCSALRSKKQNPLEPTSPRSDKEAGTLILAYTMLLQGLAVGPVRQMTTENHLFMQSDWKELRRFGKKRKQILSKTYVKGLSAEMKGKTNPQSQTLNNSSPGGDGPPSPYGITVVAKAVNTHKLFNILSQKANLLLIDLREPKHFDEGHIPRSLCVPLNPNLPRITIQDMMKGLSMPEDDIKRPEYISRVKAAIESFSRYHLVIVSYDEATTKKATNGLLRELQSLSRSSELSYLVGGYGAFEADYGHVIQGIDIDNSVVKSASDFDLPVNLPTVICPNVLYLGTIEDSASLELLRGLRITRVLLISKHPSVYTFFPREIEYMRIEPFPPSFENSGKLACAFIEQGIYEGGGRTMIVGQADSAAASFAVAYLIWKEKVSMVEATNQVQSCRPSICLSAKAAIQACDFENAMFDSKKNNAIQSEFYDFDQCPRREPKERTSSEARKLTKRILSKYKDDREAREGPKEKYIPTKIRFQDTSEVEYLKSRIDAMTNDLSTLDKARERLILDNRKLRLKIHELDTELSEARGQNGDDGEDQIFDQDSADEDSLGSVSGGSLQGDDQIRSDLSAATGGKENDRVSTELIEEKVNAQTAYFNDDELKPGPGPDAGKSGSSEPIRLPFKILNPTPENKGHKPSVEDVAIQCQPSTTESGVQTENKMLGFNLCIQQQAGINIVPDASMWEAREKEIKTKLERETKKITQRKRNGTGSRLNMETFSGDAELRKAIDSAVRNAGRHRHRLAGRRRLDREVDPGMLLQRAVSSSKWNFWISMLTVATVLFWTLNMMEVDEGDYIRYT